MRAVSPAAGFAGGFAVLTAAVMLNGTVPGERSLLRQVVLERENPMWHGWQALSDATGTIPMLVVLVVGSAVLLAARRREAATLLVVGVLVVAVVNPLLKTAVDRERPGLVEIAGEVSAGSYPSGHAAVSAALVGAAVLAIGRRLATGSRRVVIAVAAAVLLLIAASQLALGRHYPSDVLAGWLVAGFWLTVLNTLQGARARSGQRRGGGRGD